MRFNGIKKAALSIILALNSAFCWCQFLGSTSGLLQMPSAEMGPAGTVMFTSNYLNRHTTPPAWPYDTFNYGLSFILLPRIEIGYVATFIYRENYESYDEYGNPDIVTMVSQDRHMYAKLQLLQEGEFGKSWIPAVAIGVSDPTSGEREDIKDYLEFDVSGNGNGYFSRYYIVATKHFPTVAGMIGTHLGYQFNRRKDYPINGPCAALDWEPVWLQKKDFISTKFVAEYDARTFNIGFIASVWKGHIEVMVDLQALKWLSAGIRFKTVLY